MRDSSRVLCSVLIFLTQWPGPPCPQNGRHHGATARPPRPPAGRPSLPRPRRERRGRPAQPLSAQGRGAGDRGLRVDSRGAMRAGLRAPGPPSLAGPGHLPTTAMAAPRGVPAALGGQHSPRDRSEHPTRLHKQPRTQLRLALPEPGGSFMGVGRSRVEAVSGASAGRSRAGHAPSLGSASSGRLLPVRPSAPSVRRPVTCLHKEFWGSSVSPALSWAPTTHRLLTASCPRGPCLSPGPGRLRGARALDIPSPARQAAKGVLGVPSGALPSHPVFSQGLVRFRESTKAWGGGQGGAQTGPRGAAQRGGGIFPVPSSASRAV